MYTRLFRTAFPLALFMLFSLSLQGIAAASDINVACDKTQLVNAINTANAQPDADTLHLSPDCNYVFDSASDINGTIGNSALPRITTPIVIHGNGAILERDASSTAFRLMLVGSTGNVVLNNVSIRGGKLAGSHSGAAIYNNGTLAVIGGSISGGEAVGSGGLENRGVLTLVNTTISGNIGSGVTNAINGRAILLNTTISGNNGIGFYNSSSSVSAAIIGNTITGNNAVAIHNIGSPVTVTNTIIWGNLGKISGTATTTVSYSIVQGAYTGTANLSSDPLFVNPVSYTSAPTTAGDYHLQFTSPATDKGNNAALPADTFDLDGDSDTTEPLPYDRDNDKRTINGLVDIGADEETTCLPYSSPYTVPAGDTAGLARAIVCANANPDASTIILSAGIYNFTTAADTDATAGSAALPAIGSLITINGSGAILQRDQSAALFRIIRVRAQGRLTLNNVTVRGGSLANAAGSVMGGGGGILVQKSGSLTLTNSTVSENTAERGGAIYNAGQLSITDTTIADNISSESGGGLYNSESSATVTDSIFSGNTAAEIGGAIFGFGGVLDIKGSTISANSADRGGGIFNSLLNTLILTDSIVTGNNVQDSGGGVSSTHIARIINSTVSDNTATGSGGGISNSGTMTVIDSTISGNTVTTYSGGGIMSSTNTLTVVNTSITGNSARWGGGISGAKMTVINTVITGNVAIGNNGGGIYSSSGAPVVSSSTIAGNSANGLGGGIYSYDGLTVTNSIVWGNSTQIVVDRGQIAVTYSTIEGGYAGAGNLALDPMFMDSRAYAAAPTAAGDYRVQVGSPAIEAGNNSALPLDTLDLDKDLNTTEALPVDRDRFARVINGIVDHGAYEGNNCPLYASPYTVPAGESGHLRVAMYCANANADPSVINLTPGVYTFTSATFLSPSGDSALPRITTPITINGSGATITRQADSPKFRLFYVDNGGALTLDDVVVTGGNSTAFGGAIYNNGTLTVRNSTFSGNNATSRGGAIANLRTMVLENSTITANTSQSGGGIHNESQLSVINSRISGNSASSGAGITSISGVLWLTGSTLTENIASASGGGLSIQSTSAGWIANSVIAANSASNLGGGIARTNASALRITNSIISGNTAATGGGIYNTASGLTITNSTIAGNNAVTGGGIYNTPLSITIRNSIIWGNNSGIVNTQPSSAQIVITNSIVQGGHAGTGNLNVDPLFVNPINFASAPTTAGNYALQASSPAINTGNNASLPADAHDLDKDGDTAEILPVDFSGAPRIVNITVDMGAYERQNTPGVTLSKSHIAVTEGGDTDSYTIRLDTPPTHDVTLAITTTAGQVTVGPASLTFTPLNWSTEQAVTITAVNDALNEGAHSDTISHVLSSVDAAYHEMSVTGVSVSITDNDAAGITISPLNLHVTEGGAAGTYSVVLTGQPAAEVILTPTGDTQCTVSGALVFTAENWNAAQAVSVTAIDDALAEGSHACTILHTVESEAPDYDGFAASNVSVTVTDNDAAGITISPLNLHVTEGGTADTYSIVLTSQPAAEVILTPTGDTQCTVSGALVFTAENWNAAQAVSVTAIDDALAEGSHACTILHTVESEAPDYDGFAASNVSVAVTDNDAAGIAISPLNLHVTEGSAADTYSVVLASQPADDVVLTLTTGDQATTTPLTLNFTPSNWQIPQMVTVTAVDDAIYEGSHADNVTHTAASADAAYNGLTIASVSVSITDNEPPAVELITNGGFEDAGASNAVPAGWKVVNSVGDKRVCKPGKQHDGQCTFKFTGSADEKTALNQPVNLDNVTLNIGDELTLTAFIKGNNPAARVQLRLKVLYGNGETEVVKFMTMRNADYTRQSIEPMIIRHLVSQIKVNIRHKSAAGAVFIDNVSLLQMPLASRNTGDARDILPPPAAPDGFRHP